MRRVEYPPLWRCPKCGHEYVTRNMWHSCATDRIDALFAGKNPAIRELFDRFRAAVEACGPVSVYAQKTKIVFQVRARFAGAAPRKAWLHCGFWLKRRAFHPLIFRVETPTPHDHIHYFRLSAGSEFDEYVAALIREAYRVGCQESAGGRVQGKPRGVRGR